MNPSSHSSDEDPSEAAIQSKLDRIFPTKHKIGKACAPDILTDELIIEIKNLRSWREAIGQVVSYASEYPCRHKIIYLFGKWSDKYSWSSIQDSCHSCSIDVLRDDLHYDELLRLSNTDPSKGCTWAEVNMVLTCGTFQAARQDPVEKITKTDYYATMEQMTQALRYLGLSLRSLKPVRRPEAESALFRINESLRESISELKDFIDQVESKEAVAEAFIADTLTIVPDGVVSGADFGKALREWCLGKGIRSYAKYCDIIEEKLAPYNASRRKGHLGVEWHGVQLRDSTSAKSVPPSNSSDE
jgi:hypothetical protein